MSNGIHAHPTKKLGRRPQSLRPSVSVETFLRVSGTALPPHPLVDPVPPLAYPMDRNDVAGDCVVAGLDHALQTIHAALGVPRQNWTDGQLLAHYQTQNPGFRSWADGGGPNDNGMEIQTFLEHLVKTGEIVAFGRLGLDQELLKAAIWVGIAVVTGENLEVAQQGQQVWDYSPSDEWGGHCTTSVSYSASPNREGVVTWGEVVPVSSAFISHQVSEAWFVLTKAHINHPGFRDSFDLTGFAAAVSELTGGKVVVPVPAPQPPPAPVPAPGPTPAPVPAPAPVALWLQTVEPVYLNWLRHPIKYRKPFAAVLAAWKKAVVD
jgi:hypothetical protein